MRTRVDDERTDEVEQGLLLGRTRAENSGAILIRQCREVLECFHVAPAQDSFLCVRDFDLGPGPHHTSFDCFAIARELTRVVDRREMTGEKREHKYRSEKSNS